MRQVSPVLGRPASASTLWRTLEKIGPVQLTKIASARARPQSFTCARRLEVIGWVWISSRFVLRVVVAACPGVVSVDVGFHGPRVLRGFSFPPVGTRSGTQSGSGRSWTAFQASTTRAEAGQAGSSFNSRWRA